MQGAKGRHAPPSPVAVAHEREGFLHLPGCLPGTLFPKTGCRHKREAFSQRLFALSFDFFPHIGKLLWHLAYNVWYDIKGGVFMNENFPLLADLGDIDDYIYADVEPTVSER